MNFNTHLIIRLEMVKFILCNRLRKCELCSIHMYKNMVAVALSILMRTRIGLPGYELPRHESFHVRVNTCTFHIFTCLLTSEGEAYMTGDNATVT